MTLVSFDSKRTTSEFISLAFNINKNSGDNIEERLMGIIAKKKELLQKEKVQLLKLRNSKLVNPNDIEDEGDLLNMDQFALKATEEFKKQVKANDTEEDLRSNQISTLASGKENLVKLVKKMPMSKQLKMTLFIGISLFIVSLTLFLVDFIVHFSVNVASTKKMDFYSVQVKQSAVINLLMIEFQYIARQGVLPVSQPFKDRLEKYTDQLKNLKSEELRSSLYEEKNDIITTTLSARSEDSKPYKTSEIIEKIIGKVIFLKDSIEDNLDLTSIFSMNNDMFYFVFRNSFEIVLPNLEKSTAAYYSNEVEKLNFIKYTVILTSVAFCIMILMSFLMMVSLKNIYIVRSDMMNVFIKIPDNKLKVFHSQCEYFTLLFMGEDKHVDDMKTELASLRKVHESEDVSMAAGVYGKRKKQLSHSSMLTLDSCLMVSSLVFCTLVYGAVLLVISSSKSSKMHTLVPFTRLALDRAGNYMSTLNSMMRESGSLGETTRRMFDQDSTLVFLSSTSPDTYLVYNQALNKLGSKGGICAAASSQTDCEALVTEGSTFDDLAFRYKQLAYGPGGVDEMYRLVTFVMVGVSAELEKASHDMVSDMVQKANDVRILLFFLYLCFHILTFAFLWIPLYSNRLEDVRISLYFNCVVPPDVVKSQKRVRMQMMKNLFEVVV